MEHLLYIFLILLAVSFPLARSFESKVRFVRYWPGVFLGTAVMMMVFIPWDAWFTAREIWGFNSTYVIGIFIAGLPIEEWLFFMVVPFSCAFIYEVLNYFLPVPPLESVQNKITVTLIAITFAASLIFIDRLYTFTSCSLLCLFLIWHLVANRSPYLSKFYLAFVVILIPFFLMNGALTGMFTPEPVVWYNDAENLGIRLITIPVDDVAYNMLMLLIVITVLEEYKRRNLVGNLTVG